MDKLTSINVFVRIAKAGSFAGAARDLGISRAMATKHMIYLEKTLDTRLFNRTTRSLHLTEVGAAYLIRCQQLLLDVEEMEAAVTLLQAEPRGKLKISAPPVIGQTHISLALAEFLVANEDISAELILQNHSVDLIEEGIDVAIVLGKLQDTRLVARKLARSPFVVCGTPAYFSRYGLPQQPEDLVDHNCLINWGLAPRNKWMFRGILGDREVKVTGRLQANIAAPIQLAAKNDLGLVMLPDYMVGSDIETGTLQQVLEQYRVSPLEIHAVYPYRQYLSAKVRDFLVFLQNWLPKQQGMN